MAWLVRTLFAAPLVLVTAGCFLTPGSSRPDPAAPIAGPAPYIENCQACHASPVAAHYAMSLHTAKGIRCGQCHTPDGHPNFAQPIRDGKCGGCHQPQYQESIDSTHFATRTLIALDDDPRGAKDRAQRGLHRGPRRPAEPLRGRLGVGRARRPPVRRVSLRRAPSRPRRRAAGRLLHQLLTRARPAHFDFPTPEATNRCLECHVRVGETLTGQVVNSHRFAMPGAEGSGK